jgi:hypothetical protein
MQYLWKGAKICMRGENIDISWERRTHICKNGRMGFSEQNPDNRQ